MRRIFAVNSVVECATVSSVVACSNRAPRTYKLASQANSCYNKHKKMLSLSDVISILRREFNLSERRTMDIVPFHANNGNSSKKRAYLPFKDARIFVHTLGLTSQREWGN